eukprot:gene24313-32750_t
MDEVSKIYLQRLSIPCIYQSVGNSALKIPSRLRVGRKYAMSVWLARVDFMISLLASGSDILLSDVDAIWLQNPMKTLLRVANDSDIVAGKGWYPIELHRLWGSTLCLGFAYFKSSAFTIALLKEVSQLMKDEQLDPDRVDDQYSVNRVLHSWGVSWNKGELMSMSLSGDDQAVADRGVVLRAGREHVITLLAHRTVLRNCLNDSSLFPEHRYSRRGRTPRKSLTAWLLSGWREWATEDQGQADLQYAGVSSALYLRDNPAAALQQLSRLRGESEPGHQGIPATTTTTTIVAHCITPSGSSSAKMRFLRQAGLWNDSMIAQDNNAARIHTHRNPGHNSNELKRSKKRKRKSSLNS